MSVKKKNMYLLSSFTAEPLKDSLEQQMNKQTQPFEVTIGPYNQIVSSCLNENSELYKNEIDVLVVWFRLEDILGRNDFFQKEIADTAKNDVRILFEAVAHAVSKLNCKLVLVLPNKMESRPLGIFDLQVNRGTSQISFDLRNYLLEQCKKRADILTIDAEDVIRAIGSEHAYNMAMYAFAKIPYNGEVFERMAQNILRIVAVAKKQKVLVMDAEVLFCEQKDEAILNEIEEDRIITDDSGFMNQEYVKELVSWGHKFLLCTSSSEAVLDALLTRDDLPADKEDFSYILCNCKSFDEVIHKAEDIYGLTKEQLVLLDVKETDFQGEKLLLLPEDTTQWKEVINQSDVLDFLPEEDIYYETTESMEEETVELTDFFQNNHLSVDFIPAAAENLERVEHVFESVKDFNLTGREHTIEELTQFTYDEDTLLYGIKVEDRFGNYGISGAFIGKKNSTVFELENLLLNCRILGKKVEYHVMKQLGEMLQTLDLKEISIRYVSNERNQLAAEFAAELSGLELKRVLDGESIQISVSEVLSFAESHLTIEEKKTSQGEEHCSNPYELLKKVMEKRAEEEKAAMKYFVEQPASIIDIMNDIRNSNMRSRDGKKADYVEPRTDTEKKVADLWKEILNLDSIGVHDNFFTIGGTSLMAAQLIIKFKAEFDMTLPVRIFFDNSSVEQMAAYIDAIIRNNDKAELNENAVSNFRYKTREFLKNEVWLAEDITAQKFFEGKTEKVENVLLTGATGFLGAFLLHDLINKTDYTVYTFVKAENAERGLQRVINNLEKYSLWEDAFTERIRIVTGDLSKTLLGMEKTTYDELTKVIDEIYHGGAITNFLEPYQKIRDVNVFGTQEMLRFATSFKLKKIHYISTHYVFSNLSHENGFVAYEDTFPTSEEVLVLGYQQSKWVGENIMAIAKSRGVPVSVYRVGRISGSTVTGACQTKDIMWLMIKCCVEAGVLFEENVKIEFIPVDYVSQSIVTLSLREDSFNKNFHIVSKELNDLGQVYDWMTKYGFKVERMPYVKWKEELVDRAAKSTGLLTTKAMLPFIPEDMSEWDVEIMYDSTNVKNGMKENSMTEVIVTEEVFMKYLDYFVQTKFFEL